MIRTISRLILLLVFLTLPFQAGAKGEAQKRWEQLSPVIVQSMQSICRQPTINDIENWREWWKENKKDPRAWKDEKA